jgi:hypothetical protein
MGRLYDALDDSLREWIGRQHVFFVATAPNDDAGHVNLSPKGAMDTFRILGPRTVAYIDMVGSGIETVSHLQENGRIVVMFCSFAGPPKIVRLHGRGRVVPAGEPEFAALLAGFPPNEEIRALARSIIVVEATRISDSCGFVVPRLEYASDRDQLFRWAEHKRDELGDGWKPRYLEANNRVSIDGLPGLDVPEQLSDAETRALASAGKAL